MRDTIGREITYLRLSVTDLCNLRCRYCMPEEGVCKRRHEDMLTEDEMIRAVEAAASLGIRKLRITGGEPLVKKNILSVCRRAAAVPGIEELCMTTNAVLLRDRAAGLREAGVDRLNISLDTLDAGKYACMTRGGKLQEALSGMEAALEAGFQKIKINVVLIGGFNEDEIPDLAELTCSRPVDVRFIELMPMPGQLSFSEEAFLSCDAVREALPELTPVPDAGGGSTAELWKLPGAKGCIGMIRPTQTHICRTCSRLRLTADGRIKPCLHSPREYAVKGLAGEEMREQFIRAIREKPERHGRLAYDEISCAARSMNRIGG